MSGLLNLLEYCKKCIERKQLFFTDNFEVLDYKNLEGKDEIIYRDKKEDMTYRCTIDIFMRKLEESFTNAG
jgi:hypothetical protein